MRAWFPTLIAVGFCLFGLTVLDQQIFVWHHLKVVTVIGAAMLSIGLCILYEKHLRQLK